MFLKIGQNMKTLSHILKGDNNIAVTQMKHIYNIWFSSVIDDLKPITMPYDYNPYEKSLVVLVYDNLWYSELLYMEQDFIDLLGKNNLELKKITFKFKPKYEKVEKNNIVNYNITSQAENYINATCNRCNNEYMKESLKTYLTNFFHYNNFQQWITKG